MSDWEPNVSVPWLTEAVTRFRCFLRNQNPQKSERCCSRRKIISDEFFIEGDWIMGVFVPKDRRCLVDLAHGNRDGSGGSIALTIPRDIGKWYRYQLKLEFGV